MLHAAVDQAVEIGDAPRQSWHRLGAYGGKIRCVFGDRRIHRTDLRGKAVHRAQRTARDDKIQARRAFHRRLHHDRVGVNR